MSNASPVKLHIREAREDGETNERLDRLVVWEHVNDFTDKEIAVLTSTIAMINLWNRLQVSMH